MNKSLKKVEVKRGRGVSSADLVAKACALLAQAFADPYEHTDYQSGVVETRNALGFWQDKVLGGVCFQLANGLDYTRATSIPRAKEQVQRALRAHKGDELSEVALQRAVGWYQRLIEQEALADAALAEARYGYTRATGKLFSYTPRQAPNASVNVVETPAMVAAKALGINPVNVAPGFTSSEATTIETRYGERLQFEHKGPADQHGRDKELAAKAKAKRTRAASKAKAKRTRAASKARKVEAEAPATALADAMQEAPATALADAMQKALNGSTHG